MIKTIPILAALILLPFVITADAAADITITVSGNGEGSTNSVLVEQENKTEVETSNESETDTDVSSDADTGGNETNDNSGDVSIKTGDIQTETEVETRTNTTVVVTQQGTQSTSATIANNGAGSTNTVDVKTDSYTDIDIEQHAEVTNTVKVEATTGKNSANTNVGSVQIKTGSIIAGHTVKNQVNVTEVEVGNRGFRKLFLALSDNGADSDNQIDVQARYDIMFEKMEEAFVDNFLDARLITGKNDAAGNVGAVLIGTGNIAFISDIVNDPINSNFFGFGAPAIPLPTPPPPPPSPGNGADNGVPPKGNGNGNGDGEPDDGNGGGVGNGNGDNGDDNGDGVGQIESGAAAALGAFGGDVLPVTGNGINPLLVFGMSLLLLLNAVFLKRKSHRAFLTIA